MDKDNFQEVDLENEVNTAKGQYRFFMLISLGFAFV